MSRRTNLVLLVATTTLGAMLGWLGWCRYAAFHNETFDLALYARMAWGFAHVDLWDPIVDAHFLGVHVSPVLVPLGLLGNLVGTVPVLLVAQVVAVMAAAWPIARMGQRWFGPPGALAGAAVWLLQPNLGHVLTYEFHPGTLAVLPLAWAFDALDRRDPRGLLLAVTGVLLCREDWALVTAMLGLVAVASGPRLRPAGILVAAGSVAYVLVFALSVAPRYAPAEGSLQAHFGHWGRSIGEIGMTLVSRPADVLAHLAEEQRAVYVASLLLPVALLPLLRPRLLVVAAAPIAMNLLSRWPSATQMESHYQTALMPIVVVAALDAVRRLPEHARRPVLDGLVTVSALVHVLHGGTPIAATWKSAPFIRDESSVAAQAVVDAIPARASVQAPYELLPHLAERTKVHVAPPPERETDYVVLDAWHRAAWEGSEDFLRTDQERLVRLWLARDDYGLEKAAGPFLLLRRGASPRGGPAVRYLEGRARAPDRGTRLSACLGLRSAWIEHDEIVIQLVARGSCPADLAVRIGTLERPARVDPLFDGLLSPRHLERGDLVISRHRFDSLERERWARFGVRVGLVRSSGARPTPDDPVSVKLRLPRSAYYEGARTGPGRTLSLVVHPRSPAQFSPALDPDGCVAPPPNTSKPKPSARSLPDVQSRTRCRMHSTSPRGSPPSPV